MDNKQVAARVEELERENAHVEVLEGENAWLREQLGFVNTYSEYTMVDAKITGRSTNNYSETFTLNRGTESGVDVNMAVITPSGVVGYVKDFVLGWCRVVTVTDPTSAVGVYTATGLYGTVEGSTEWRQDGYAVMHTDALIEAETMLYSTGYGNIYPAGLPVGKIVSSEKDKYGHVYTYTVDPAVDFDAITYVMIVTGKTVSAGGAG